jgi:divalent metal cation (Fe/Co/Zn/Cd) transporter
MTDLSPRPNRTPRRVREERAYKLVMAGGAAAVVSVVTFVLAIVGIVGFGIPVLAAIVAILCGWLFRRTVSP